MHVISGWRDGKGVVKEEKWLLPRPSTTTIFEYGAWTSMHRETLITKTTP
jgi:hypothetical protein